MSPCRLRDSCFGGVAYHALAVPNAGRTSTTDAPVADGAAGAPAGGEDGRRRGVELERRRGDAVGQRRARRITDSELAWPGR